MTATYARDEIISSTQLQTAGGKLLDMLKKKKKKKFAVSRNNTIEVVMLPVEYYETLKTPEEVEEILEHLEIARIIEERKDEKTIPFSEIKKEYGLV